MCNQTPLVCTTFWFCFFEFWCKMTFRSCKTKPRGKCMSALLMTCKRRHMVNATSVQWPSKSSREHIRNVLNRRRYMERSIDSLVLLVLFLFYCFLIELCLSLVMNVPFYRSRPHISVKVPPHNFIKHHFSSQLLSNAL